jgi:hypothetical protein
MGYCGLTAIYPGTDTSNSERQSGIESSRILNPVNAGLKKYCGVPEYWKIRDSICSWKEYNPASRLSAAITSGLIIIIAVFGFAP